ncbi:MAG: hypothetical protein MSIBF_05925 [Candidatus Altiarchaeales archaeon IMC4]|nr:MAG: hypothetical protein MSIBF_05925 [Candidatus Altiarchaeales archaeon IMC4]
MGLNINVKKMLNLPDEDKSRGFFREACENLGIDASPENVAELVIYEMTDGTRTSTDLTGDDAYFDGGMFILRFIHILKALGGRNLYVNVIHEGHKNRTNYAEIYRGMLRHVEVYGKYAAANNVRLRFVGDYGQAISPDGSENDIRQSLQKLEKLTEKNDALTVHFMVNYSTRWAAGIGKDAFAKLPDVNMILRHAKGYVNGDMWLFGKLDSNSFMYVQNGSSSVNFSDRQIAYMIAVALRSMLVNRGTHLSKKYLPGENDEVKQKREVELSMVHRSFHQGEKPKKRAVIFSSYGPEVYEF